MKGCFSDPTPVRSADDLEISIWKITAQGARQREFTQMMALLHDNIDHLDTPRMRANVRQYLAMLEVYDRMSIYFKILSDFNKRNKNIYRRLFEYLASCFKANLDAAKKRHASQVSIANYVFSILSVTDEDKISEVFWPDIVSVLEEFDVTLTPMLLICRQLRLAYFRDDPFFEQLADIVIPKNINAAFLCFMIILSSERGKIKTRLRILRERLRGRGLVIQTNVDALRFQIIMNYNPLEYSSLSIIKRDEQNMGGELAILLSGQLRTDSIMVNFINDMRSCSSAFEVFVSTWEDRGEPPVRDGFFRNYDPEIQVALLNVCHKHSISMVVFEEKYHVVNKTEKVTFDELRDKYDTNNIHIHSEGNLPFVFKNNQERLFFKIHDAYQSAILNRFPSVFIRARPDQDVVIDMDEVQQCIQVCRAEENVLFVPNFPLIDTNFPFVNDNFAIAGRRAMMVYASLFDATIKGVFKPLVSNDAGGILGHISLANWLLINHVDIRLFRGYKLNGYTASSSPVSKEDYRRHLLHLIETSGHSPILDDLLSATD